MEPKTEIVKKGKNGEVQGNCPADMIRMAVAGGADLDKLEKLLTLQERWEANEARKLYHEAMAAFKSNPPKIEKDKSVNYGAGKAAFKHATLANVVEKITGELSKHGLSASWRTQQNGLIVVSCRITHVKGHSEEVTLSAPADTSGSKNPIQSIGSTISYLERYTLLAATGLATYDQDDDGHSAHVETVSEEQLGALRDFITQYGVNEEKFLKFMKIEKLEDMAASDYTKAVNAMKAKVKK